MPMWALQMEIFVVVVGRDGSSEIRPVGEIPHILQKHWLTVGVTSRWVENTPGYASS